MHITYSMSWKGSDEFETWPDISGIYKRTFNEQMIGSLSGLDSTLDQPERDAGLSAGRN